MCVQDTLVGPVDCEPHFFHSNVSDKHQMSQFKNERYHSMEANSAIVGMGTTDRPICIVSFITHAELV